MGNQNIFCLQVEHLVYIACMVFSISHKNESFSAVIKLVLNCLCIVYDTMLSKCSEVAWIGPLLAVKGIIG